MWLECGREVFSGGQPSHKQSTSVVQRVVGKARTGRMAQETKAKKKVRTRSWTLHPTLQTCRQLAENRDRTTWSKSRRRILPTFCLLGKRINKHESTGKGNKVKGEPPLTLCQIISTRCIAAVSPLNSASNCRCNQLNWKRWLFGHFSLWKWLKTSGSGLRTASEARWEDLSRRCQSECALSFTLLRGAWPGKVTAVFSPPQLQWSPSFVTETRVNTFSRTMLWPLRIDPVALRHLVIIVNLRRNSYFNKAYELFHFWLVSLPNSL